jgi:hypothetical protein
VSNNDCANAHPAGGGIVRLRLACLKVAEGWPINARVFASPHSCAVLSYSLVLVPRQDSEMARRLTA